MRSDWSTKLEAPSSKLEIHALVQSDYSYLRTGGELTPVCTWTVVDWRLQLQPVVSRLERIRVHVASAGLVGTVTAW